HKSFFQMTDRATPDERFGNRAHFDRGDHARDDAVLFERVLEREGVDHGGKHAHVVSGRTVHAARTRREAAEQIAAADHDADLDTELLYFADFGGDLIGDGGIDPERLFAHQGLAGKFEEYAGVNGLGH